MKRLIFILTAVFIFVTGSAFATTYTIEDTWTDWPSYVSDMPDVDAHGTPQIASMSVSINDDTLLLESVTINLSAEGIQKFNTLFINSYSLTTTNTDWDDWDYTVHSGGDWQTNQANITETDGLYSVNSGYEYTLTNQAYYPDVDIRDNTPNSIDKADLNYIGALDADYDSSLLTIVYDFSNYSIDTSNGLYLAYSEWCGNDVIGGNPVPEPATFILLGSALIGLGFYQRRNKKA